ncbi:uncharacterized protein CLUP02_05908 [Colletotrichum lupini]|uniref:Uncharacterized protein n=1 Tax=Colletotrichum lupini TaxID=145971 RepID=A0A9Q8SP01_9PEZI|nr:uncharacterized protein CLUP02_05908 [Colletotrichum lupini]UQC80425.1 hypothetical protein CLUP02_05908 [Colletotrichum lupini]
MSTPQVRHLPEYPLMIMSTHLIDWHSIRRETIPLPPSLPTRSAIFSNFGSPAPTVCPRGGPHRMPRLSTKPEKTSKHALAGKAGFFKQGLRHNLNDILLYWSQGGRGKGGSLGQTASFYAASSLPINVCFFAFSHLLRACGTFRDSDGKATAQRAYSSPPTLIFNVSCSLEVCPVGSSLPCCLDAE